MLQVAALTDSPDLLCLRGTESQLFLGSTLVVSFVDGSQVIISQKYHGLAIMGEQSRKEGRKEGRKEKKREKGREDEKKEEVRITKLLRKNT